jgi:hypothetical protein
MSPLSAWRHDLQLFVYVSGVRNVFPSDREPPHGLSVIVKTWLSDPQTTGILELPIPKSAIPQWFYGYLVLC